MKKAIFDYAQLVLACLLGVWGVYEAIYGSMVLAYWMWFWTIVNVYLAIFT